MESFAGESFEIVELDNALSYWEFIGASDAVDSDYEFEVRSFDDGVSSLRSSISDSPSLSHSVDQSIDLDGPIESEEEDRGLDSGDLGGIGVEAESVVHEALRSRFSDKIEPEEEDRGVDSVAYTESVVNEVLRSRISGKIEAEEEDLGVDSRVCTESVVNEEEEDHSDVQDLGLSFSVNLVHDDAHIRDYDWQAHRYSSDCWYQSCDCDDDSDEEFDEDLDDELVPWSVAGKFGRQRIRKLGKRTSVKTSSSKQLARVKRGCVRGKHGLGVKHSL